MNDKVYIFGETEVNFTNSNFTYANALTFDIMLKFAEADNRFDNYTQADILNLALVILYGFVAPEDHTNMSKSKFHEFVDDFDEFKDFALFTMNKGRRANEQYNSVLSDLFERE